MSNYDYIDNVNVKTIPAMANNVTCPVQCKLCVGDTIYTTISNTQSYYNIDRYVCRVDGLPNGTGEDSKFYDVTAANGTGVEVSEDAAGELGRSGQVDYYFVTWSNQITCLDTSPIIPPVVDPECIPKLQNTLNLFKIN